SLVVDARPAACGAIVQVAGVVIAAGAHRPVIDEVEGPVDVAAAVLQVAVGVPAGVLIEVDVAAPEPAIRFLVAELQPVADGTLVGPPQEPDVVDVEARRLERRVRVERNALAGDLADPDRRGAAGQHRPGGIELGARGIGTLEVVPAVLLNARDRLWRAAQTAAHDVPRDRVSLLEAEVPVDAAGVGAARQESKAVAELTLHARHHESDRRLAGELAPGPSDGLARERVDAPL